MARGQTWSYEEVQALLDIWSDDNISQLLVATHKNYEVFKLFSERLAARGFNRSVVQCRIKVKKLRHQYVKIRESLRRSGGSGEEKEKEKFVWYEDLDGILGTRPTSSPKYGVETFQEEVPLKWTPEVAAECSVGREADRSGDRSYVEVHLEEDESTTRSRSPRPQQETNTLQRAIPGAQGRKRKSRTERSDTFLESFMKRKLDEAVQKRHDEERAAFENFIRMQQEAEERRFRAIQEQQQANSQLLLHMMGNFARALLPHSHILPAAVANPHNTPSPRETSEHPAAPMPKHLPETMAPRTTSSVLHDFQALIDCLSNGMEHPLRDSWCEPLEEDVPNEGQRQRSTSAGDDEQMSDPSITGGFEEENGEEDVKREIKRETPLSSPATSTQDMKPEITNKTEDTESASIHTANLSPSPVLLFTGMCGNTNAINSEHNAAQSKATSTHEGPVSTCCNLDTIDLDKLKREKIKLQLKVLKLQAEYYALKIKELKK